MSSISTSPCPPATAPVTKRKLTRASTAFAGATRLGTRDFRPGPDHSREILHTRSADESRWRSCATALHTAWTIRWPGTHLLGPEREIVGLPAGHTDPPWATTIWLRRPSAGAAPTLARAQRMAKEPLCASLPVRVGGWLAPAVHWLAAVPLPASNPPFTGLTGVGCSARNGFQNLISPRAAGGGIVVRLGLPVAGHRPGEIRPRPGGDRRGLQLVGISRGRGPAQLDAGLDAETRIGRGRRPSRGRSEIRRQPIERRSWVSWRFFLRWVQEDGRELAKTQFNAISFGSWKN